MKAAAFAGNLLNVRSGEWRRLLLLYAMGLATLTGCNWADAIVQGAFLQRVGVRYLPLVIIGSAACSISALFIYSAFADRVSNTRLLIAILAISGAGILLGLALLAAGLAGPAYLLLFVVLQVPLLDVYNVHWATYVNSFYDIRAAKRIVPVLSTAARLAGIIAGLSMPLMNRLFSPAAIIGATLASLAIMATLAAAMPRLLREPRDSRRTPAGAAMRGQEQGLSAYSARLREGYQQIARSPFLRWMALTTLSMTLLLTLLNYAGSAILQRELRTTVAIADFLGVLSGVANLVVLPFQLFVLSRLIARLGLGNAALVYPLVTLAAAGSLVVAPGLSSAGLAYLDRTALRTAFRIPTDNLLYNAVPQRVKARTRAFVGGLVVPAGAVAGGLLLLTPLTRTSWFLPAAMLVLALSLALAAWMVRRHYGQALVDLLEHEDYSALAVQAPSLPEPAALAADPATLARLAQKLSESASAERTVFLAQLITAVGGEAAVPVVAQAVRAAASGRLRAALVDVLVAAEVRGGEARDLFTGLLGDADGQVRLAAIGGLEQLDGPGDERYLQIAGGLLADRDLDVRLRVLPALVAADDPGRHAAGVTELRTLLNAGEPHTRARALAVTGQARAGALLPEVMRLLADGADEVRLAAALALEGPVTGELPLGSREGLLASLRALLHDPVERVRVAAVTVLDWLSNDMGADAVALHEILVQALADPSPEVRDRAVAVLAVAGESAVPQVLDALNHGDAGLRNTAVVVLARIDPHRYAPLVHESILSGTLLPIYRDLSCWLALANCRGPAVAVLQRALRERNTTRLDEIFYLLATIQEPAVIQTIARSLRSPQPEVRANATEALESVTAPQAAALIGPLFEPDLAGGPLLSLARQTWNLTVPTPAAALRLLLVGVSDGWQRTLAAAALAELSAANDPAWNGELAGLLSLAQADPDAGVRRAARTDGKGTQEDTMLSDVDKVILLKEVPFFQGMTIEQLRVLAYVCEEEFFPAQSRLFNEGDPGGVLYVVVSGRVGIEQEKRKGSFARLATVEAHSYLGEADLFDDNRRTNSAIAIQDTLTLRLRREPLVALARQYPELSLELINVLSVRLREANERIAELTRTHPREIHKLFDQLT